MYGFLRFLSFLPHFMHTNMKALGRDSVRLIIFLRTKTPDIIANREFVFKCKHSAPRTFHMGSFPESII